MPHELRRRFAGALMAAALFGCAAAPPPVRPTTASSPAAAGDPSSAPTPWTRTELYFAIGDAGMSTDQLAAAESRWSRFLDTEVTPRFPDGLTVLDASGQWQQRGAGAPQRERSKVLVIVHEATPARDADLELIRQRYKLLTGEQSVLRVSSPAAASF